MQKSNYHIKILIPKGHRKKNDIKTNLLRKNANLFAKYTLGDINASIRSSKYPSELKHADIVPAHEKCQSCLSKIIGLAAFFQTN